MGQAVAQQAPTLAQLKIEHQQSLWEYIAAIPSSMEFQIVMGLALAGVIGMLASWLLKWARGQAGPLWHYLFTDKVRFTVLAASSYIGVCAGAVTADIFTSKSGEFVGWANVLWFGISNAFGLDLAANKGANGSVDNPAKAEDTLPPVKP